ncbi:nucleoside hydrolase [Limnovirga soli]|uniref:Nucleoside hydrolase n=1 Tax=Limnovirga soli TaxID=2656915 RepID=A0A8J8FDW0_9BACT|nr:nucleoside hydrolase [Limnovirga soli]NNV54136.1 nucleoside hydrolase [Limnovirga soli]
MKRIFVCCALMIFFGAYTSPKKPVAIIFDTDIAPDYDDVGAMALLHAFADMGEAKILATISCNAFETTVPTLSVLNTYFNRPEIPIGIVQGHFPNKDCSQQWAQAIIASYPHVITSNSMATDAVTLYRKILAAQPDNSVTIVSVGFFTNLANLLGSSADTYSPLDGTTLVKKKVKKLVSMAARIGDDGKTGYEFNVMVDAAASKKVFANWPTQIVMSGFEIGEKILTGIPLIHNAAIQHSPVKDAFTVALTKDNNTLGRNSWDETAVLVAVRGIEPWFNTRQLHFDVEADGKNVLIPGDKITYLGFKQTPETIANTIEQLIMHQPVK